MDPAAELQWFREEVRRQAIGPRYRGALHLGSTLLGCALGIAAALWCIQDLRLRELWLLPMGLLVANAVEYLAHRFVMHRRVWPLSFLHARHVGLHHRFFAGELQSIESHRDMKVVLFPPPVIAFFLLGIAAPLGLLLSLVMPGNAAALFVVAAVTYYGTYEVLHLIWHLPDAHPLLRLPGLKRLRAHHRAHHADMQRGFNVTFPVMDTLLRTRP